MCKTVAAFAHDAPGGVKPRAWSSTRQAAPEVWPINPQQSEGGSSDARTGPIGSEQRETGCHGLECITQMDALLAKAIREKPAYGWHE